MVAIAVAEVAPWVGLAAAITVCLLVDLFFFARGREPTLREGVVWSIGWLVLSLLAALVVLARRGLDAAVNYTTVYLIERSLSLDNLFVFLRAVRLLRRPHAVPREAAVLGHRRSRSRCAASRSSAGSR